MEETLLDHLRSVVNPKSLAVIDECNGYLTYGQLLDRVDSAAAALPDEKALVYLEVSNDLQSLVWYLACLKKKHAVILQDATANNAHRQRLKEIYQPSITIDGSGVCVTPRSGDIYPELAILLSTSGSTGSPKLVRLSNKNLLSNAKSIVQYMELTSDDRAITVLPIYYSYGLSVINSHLIAGGSLILTNKSLMSREFWQLFDEFRPTFFSGVPYTYEMLRRLGYHRLRTDSLRLLTQAGGALDREHITYMLDVTEARGQSFMTMYGQTEATARISYVPSEKMREKIGSIGIPIPGGKMHLLDERGEKIRDPYVDGEIVYEGDNVMLGYASSTNDLSKGDENKGVLRTGDIGYFDDEGYFYVTGRKKRFIKLFGNRISLDQIENHLRENKIDAAAGGDDTALHIVVTKDGNSEAARDLIASTFSINKNYIRITIVSEIPRKSNGKVDYKRLFGSGDG